MRPTILVLLLIFPLFYLNGTSGKGIIPFFWSDYSNTTDSLGSMIYISNITGNPVQVEITLYDELGNRLGDDGSLSTGIIRATNTVKGYSDKPGAGDQWTLSFTLPPHRMIKVWIMSEKTSLNGHGVIAWTGEGSETKRLVAYGRCFKSYWNSPSLETTMPILIENGAPF